MKRAQTAVLGLALCGVAVSLPCVPNVMSRLSAANCAVALSDLHAIASALGAFAADHQGLVPAALPELFAEDESGHAYLDVDSESMPQDPWGHEYIYLPKQDRSGFRVLSFGSDGVPGGEGDAQDVVVDSDKTEH